MKTQIQELLLADLDQRVPALRSAQAAAATPAGGWLRAVRQALGLAQADAARRAGVTQQALAQFERGEARGTISLGSLQRAAEAMDCDVVCYLVPRPARATSFRELARQLDPDFVHLQASEHSMSLEGQAVGDLPPPAGGPTPLQP